MHFFFTGPRIMGIRPGVVLDAANLISRRSLESPIEGSFVYVIQAREELVKIGVSTDPRARIAALQTGSAFELTFAGIAATPGSGYDIEAAAHLVLRPYRMEGEWFGVPASVALATITVAARRLGEPILSVSLEEVDRILAIARNPPQDALSRSRGILIKFLKIAAGSAIGSATMLVLSLIFRHL